MSEPPALDRVRDLALVPEAPAGVICWTGYLRDNAAVPVNLILDGQSAAALAPDSIDKQAREVLGRESSGGQLPGVLGGEFADGRLGAAHVSEFVDGQLAGVLDREFVGGWPVAAFDLEFIDGICAGHEDLLGEAARVAGLEGGDVTRWEPELTFRGGQAWEVRFAEAPGPTELGLLVVFDGRCVTEIDDLSEWDY